MTPVLQGRVDTKRPLSHREGCADSVGYPTGARCLR